mgnify:CR=1 FL=1
MWRACVGRVHLYFLDADVDGNPDEIGAPDLLFIEPELVVVVESPVSEARMREMFKAVDAVLLDNRAVTLSGNLYDFTAAGESAE